MTMSRIYQGGGIPVAFRIKTVLNFCVRHAPQNYIDFNKATMQ